MKNEIFNCNCNGKTKAVSADEVLHACNHKGSPCTSYYDGIERFITYQRVQINPALTNGKIEYNWFVKWEK